MFAGCENRTADIASPRCAPFSAPPRLVEQHLTASAPTPRPVQLHLSVISPRKGIKRHLRLKESVGERGVRLLDAPVLVLVLILTLLAALGSCAEETNERHYLLARMN
jgi:hypothetical protein